MIIRPVNESEYSSLYDFVKSAFTTAYMSNGEEQDYASSIRASSTYIKELEYVVDESGKIIGDIIVSKYSLPNNVNAIMINLVCVDVDNRNIGLGRSLIEVVCIKAKELGYKAVLVVGDKKFFSKLSFKPTVEFGLKNSNGYNDDMILCKELEENALKDAQGLFNFII